VGFHDPLSTPALAAVSVTAIARSEVLVFERRSLAQLLAMCHEQHSLDLARKIEAEYNKLMLSVKARAQQRSSAADRQALSSKGKQVLRFHHDFSHASNLEHLAHKVEALEAQIDATAAKASSARFTIESQLSAIASVIKEGTAPGSRTRTLPSWSRACCLLTRR
jgi:hypothetical protein